MFFKKATEIDEIFTVNLTLTTQCQIEGEDFVKLLGRLRKHNFYMSLDRFLTFLEQFLR